MHLHSALQETGESLDPNHWPETLHGSNTKTKTKFSQSWCNEWLQLLCRLFFKFSFPPYTLNSASPLSLSHALSDWVALKYLIIVDGNWHHWNCFPVMVELLWTNYTRETVAAISMSPRFEIWAPESEFSNIAYLNCENGTVLKCYWEFRGE